MTRRHITFACGDDTLAATLDGIDGRVGLLIVSGGNELRSGAFSSQAQIANKIAFSGHPSFRFDRRGVGDSNGENLGFRHEVADISSACGEFRRLCPSLQKIVAFGNCDAASALMLLNGAHCDALVLANPWTFDEDAAADMPPEAIRARYAQKLANPREWVRLLRGGVSFTKLASGLTRIFSKAQGKSNLAGDMRQGLEAFEGDVSFLIAGRDRTGQAFRSVWGTDDRIEVRDGADHAFSAPQDREWLTAQLLSALDEQARQLDMG